jgi:hypothetical protein
MEIRRFNALQYGGEVVEIQKAARGFGDLEVLPKVRIIGFRPDPSPFCQYLWVRNGGGD